MIVDFYIMGGGGVAITDRDTGAAITGICYANDRDGLYARWWHQEEAIRIGALAPSGSGTLIRQAQVAEDAEHSAIARADAEYLAMFSQMVNPTRLVVHRCNINLSIDAEDRPRYDRFQDMIESPVWLASRKAARPAPSDIIVGNPIVAALRLARPGTKAIMEAEN